MDLEPIYQAAAQEWNVHPALLKAVAGQESGGTSDADRAVSPKGAKGRMQIMDATAADLGVTDQNDPAQSIYGGAKYLSQMLDRYKQPELALAAYNAGPGRVDAYLSGKAPLPAETAAYVPAVAKRFQTFSGAGAPSKSAAPVQAQAARSLASEAAPSVASEAQPGAAPEAPDAFSAALSAAQAPPKAGDAAAAPDPFGDALAQAGKETAPASAAKPADAGPVMADPYGTPWVGEGSPTVADGQAAARKAAAGVSEDSVRATLAPAPGTTYGEVLPFAKDDATGAVRLALPGGVRNMLTGLLDLSQGPRTGTVTPDATNALAGIMMGGMASPVAGTGKAIAEAAAQRAAAPRGVWTEELPRFTAAPGSTSERFASAAAAEGTPPANMLPIAPEAGAAAQTRAVASEPLPPAASAGPSAGMGGPNAAGAQASTVAEAAMTPDQIKANRRQAEVSRAVAVPDGPNTRILVPGSEPTLAEHSYDPVASQKETLLRQRNPDAFEGPDGRLTKNSAARVNFYEDMMGSETQVQGMREARTAQGRTDIDNILANAKPTDATPALDAITAPLTDPRNRNRDAVQKYLAPMREKLFNDDGSLKTDPNELWGIRDDIRDKIDTIASVPTSTMKYVQSELIDYRDALDGVLNQATDGHYQTYLDNWAQASKPINEMELLQKNRLALTDTKGNIMPGRFSKFVTDLAYKRGKAGIDPSMDITDTTMQKLLDLNDDLKRSGNIDLGKARGSPTNLFGALAQGAGLAAAHAGAAVVAPIAGNMAIQGALNVAKPVLAARRLNKLTNLHLAPPENGFAQYRGPD